MTRKRKTTPLYVIACFVLVMLQQNVFAEPGHKDKPHCEVIRAVNTFRIDDAVAHAPSELSFFSVNTGPEGELIAHCGHVIFKLRPDSQVTVSRTDNQIDRVELTSGGLMVLMKKGPKGREVRIHLGEGMVELTKGGLYLERLEKKSYVSIEQGLARLMIPDKSFYEHLMAKERPEARYFYTSLQTDKTIRKAPLKYYSSQEFLALYEQLGMEPKFNHFAGAESRPKRKFP